MKTDIILCGVGGQGILSIATVLSEAARLEGIFLKQSEIHGMSQRGGSVQSDLRLSQERIWSDLIPDGKADLIISMEPMEALRHAVRLKKTGVIVTSSSPLRNIADYPDTDAILDTLTKSFKTEIIDIEKKARQAGNPKGANIVLLGAAAKYIEVPGPEKIRQAIAGIFARKGQAVVDANLSLFDSCYENI